jgi:hypothetical protein
MAITVDLFDTKGLSKSLAAFDALIKKADDLNKKLSTGPGGYGGGGRGSSSRITGPYSRAINAQARLQAALASGNPIAIADAQYAHNSAQNRLASLNQSPGSKALKQLAYSTRINAGPVSPLLGKMVQAAGILGPEAQAAAVAIGLLATAATAGARHIADISNIRVSTGASFTNAAIANTFGGDVAGSANNLANRLSGGGVAESMAKRLGVSYAHDPIGKGNQDNVENFFKLEDALRKMPVDKALAMARILGDETLGRLRLLSDAEYERTKRLGETQKVLGPSAQEAADLNQELDNLVTTMKMGAWLGFKFASAIGGPLLEGLHNIENVIASISKMVGGKGKKDTIENASKNLNDAARALNGAADAIGAGRYGANTPGGIRGEQLHEAIRAGQRFGAI